MNEYWERELYRLARRLCIWKALSVLDHNALENNISKNILLSAIILRKVIEDEHQIDKEFQLLTGDNLKRPRFRYLLQTLPVVRYPFCGGNVAYIVECPFPPDYGPASEQADISLYEICNSIVHSYVWALPRTNRKQCVQGFLVSSDRKQSKYLNYVLLDDWIKVLREKPNTCCDTLVQFDRWNE